ncbi:hypothetical protein DY000_02024533 [Brassica cretica]|uniref:Uncharacterized protein n=1 Tax=Brassica cretica TaxID=69181 RepID=A0ABQ7EJS9_BRACR|nr:hypothetical protein DY000_02024533 [Brassica cretica]
MVRGDAPIRSHDLKTSISCLNGRVKGIRKLRHDQNKLGTSQGQLNSAWRSVQVRISVVGSERLPNQAGGSCGTMGPCVAKAETGLGQRLGELVFGGETAKKQLGG